MIIIRTSLVSVNADIGKFRFFDDIFTITPFSTSCSFHVDKCHPIIADLGVQEIFVVDPIQDKNC